MDEINVNCLGCHSADHVLNHPPLTKEGWEEAVNKMINAYKAPVSLLGAGDLHVLSPMWAHPEIF